MGRAHASSGETNMRINCSIKKNLILIYAISFIISAVPALFLTAPPVEDCIGTIGTAAYLAGYDFRDFLVAEGFFYKYGQTIWYLPVFLLFNSAEVIYKGMLLINSAIDAFVPVMAYYIGIKICGKKRSNDIIIASILVGCLPEILLNTKYTWAEPVLIIMPWIIICVLFRAVEGKNKMSGAILAWGSVYAFMCHQRGIVLVIATLITIFMLRRWTNKKIINLTEYFLNLAIALGVDRCLNGWERKVIYLGVKPKYNTLSNFLHIEIYKKLFSIKGITVVVKTFLGWLFNIAVSGYGVTLIGLAFIFIILIEKCRCYLFCIHNADNSSVSRDEHVVFAKISTVFCALMFVGSLLLGILFFFETLYGYWYEGEVTRCDHLVFGRYIESVLPMIFFAGMLVIIYAFSLKYELFVRKIFMMLIVAAGALNIFFVIFLLPAMKDVDSYVHSLMPLNINFDMTGVKYTQDTIGNLPEALALSGIVAWGLLLFYYFLWKKGFYYKKINCGIYIVYALLFSLFIYIYVRSFIDIVYRIDSLGLMRHAQEYLAQI